MSTSLRSNQWSCSELMKGATIAADLAGMDLRVDPSTLSQDELLQSIQEAKALLNKQQVAAPKFLKPKEEIPDTVPAAQEEIDAMLAQPVNPSQATAEHRRADNEDDRRDLKRQDRPVTEKVSPEKKIPKTGGLWDDSQVDSQVDSQPDLVPQTLNFEHDGDVEIPPSTGGSADMIPGTPNKTPSSSAPPDPSEPPSPSSCAVLTALLDRIASLEAQIKQQPAPPPSGGSLPPSGGSLETPPVKARAVASPATSASEPPDSQASRGAVPKGSEVETKAVGDTPATKGDGKGDDMLKLPSGKIVISHDALRMRLRRLCEVKARSKKCHVDEATHAQYMKGGESREWLEIALAETIDRLGVDCKDQKKMRAEFQARVVVVRERMETKEQETTGVWLTEFKMKKSGDYTPESIKSIIAYCSRFPTALVRNWKYDQKVREYFVETETKQTIKASELLKRQETVELGEREVAGDDDLIKSPRKMEIVDESELTPEPEKVGDKVLPDLQRFMDSVHGRIMACQKLGEPIETHGAESVAARELLHDLKRISDNLTSSFAELAELKAELILNEEGESITEEFKKKLAKTKEAAKKPCAALIAIESRQKLVLSEIKKKPDKNDKGDKGIRGPNGNLEADGTEAVPKCKAKAKPASRGKAKAAPQPKE